MHRVLHRMTAEELHGILRDLIHGAVGGETQKRHQYSANCKHRGSRGLHIAPLLPVLMLRLSGDEEDVEQPRHVGESKTAGEQEEPLRRVIRRRVQTLFGKKRCVFDDALMQKGLADIAAEAGDARDGAGAGEEGQHQQGLAAPEAADIVEVQGMYV